MNRFAAASVPIVVLCLAGLLSSCTHFDMPQFKVGGQGEAIESMSPESAAVAGRIELARELIEDNEFSAAERTLLPVMDVPEFSEEIAGLLQTINQGKAYAARQLAKEHSKAVALREVDQRLVLPENYGRTILITPNMDPQSIPVGRMEELFHKPIDLSVYGADVRTLVIALSEIDGLNILADQALSSEKTLDVNVKGVPLGELLAYIAANLDVSFHLGEHMIWVTEAEPGAGAGPELETRVYRLNRGYIPGFAEQEEEEQGGGGFGGGRNGDRNQVGNIEGRNVKLEAQDELLDALTDFLETNPNSPDEAAYTLFRNNNVLMIRNNRKNLRLAEEIMRAFDVIPPQILIEARFVTLGQSDLFQLGVGLEDVQYERVDENGVPTFRLGGVGANIPFASDAGGAPGRLQLAGVLDEVSYSAVIEAVERARSSEMLSAPRITVLNNQQASLRKETTEFYYEEFERGDTLSSNTNTSTSLNGSGALVPTGQPTQLDTGLALNVKPSIGHDQRGILLAIQATISELVEFRPVEIQEGDTTTEFTKLPVIDKNTLTTVATVNSGETVVLGGMLETTQTETESQVPFLGDLPLVGNLFKRRDNTTDPKHLLIFLTATIVDQDGRFNTANPRRSVP